jgi:uncharacterized protein YkwD
MARARLGIVAALVPALVGAFVAGPPALAAHARRHHAGAAHACPDANLLPTRSDLSRIRAAVVCLVNRERAGHGERPLRPNRRLRIAAQGHSASMAAAGYFNHIGPGGQTPLSRVRASGYLRGARRWRLGENIAWGTLWLAAPRAIVATWMASPGHRANILNPSFRDTAIGVAPGIAYSLAHGQAGAMYTEDFGAITGR